MTGKSIGAFSSDAGIGSPKPNGCIIRIFFGLLLFGSFLSPSVDAAATEQFPAKVFAPYVDVLAWPTFSIRDTYNRTGQQFYTLAFIVSGGSCTPSWGGVVPLSEDWYVDQIDFIRSVGGDVIVSLGGANGTELAQSCSNVTTLQAAYQSVVDKYHLKWIDFDIEGAAVADIRSINRRNKAIKGLQAANPDLKVAFCLPVAPQGLTAQGLKLLKNAKKVGVRIDVVNIMAMDYGDGIAPAPEGRMGSYAIDAAKSTRRQLKRLGIEAKLGITPMIGQNDVPTERFYLSDAKQLLEWASARGQQSSVAMLSMWSSNRDNGACPGGPAQAGCSGIEQNDFDFTNTFFSFSFGGNGNYPPEVQITRPDDRTVFPAGADVTVNAEASDRDGIVTQVEFFQGPVSMGIDTVAPYAITLQNVQTGTYMLAAVATDDRQATRRSIPVRIYAGDVCTAEPWDRSTVYWGDEVVSFEDHEWKARWWTQGEQPGSTGEWGVWLDLGPCGTP